jgi:predicted DNA-binding WGR domain protein
MVEATLQILLRRHDSTRNVARYYVLAIEPSLYGKAALVRAWGRIGSLGRQRLDPSATTDASGEALEVWLARKMRRGNAPAASEVGISGLLTVSANDVPTVLQPSNARSTGSHASVPAVQNARAS